MSDLKYTPLTALHQKLGAKLVDFAGYAMPLQFDGMVSEHQWTRAHAGLFDVSHMGQVGVQTTAGSLESVLSGNIAGLKQFRLRYALLLNETGGIVDDLMITRMGETAFGLVVNAACKEKDYAYLTEALGDKVRLSPRQDLGLLALQGPEAEAALDALVPGVADLDFMSAGGFEWQGTQLWVSRCGYTGEDGFEISIAAKNAESLAQALLDDARVKPIGLGARDSLRLEAGLCLYGHDIDDTTSPVEANLMFALPKVRRERRNVLAWNRMKQEIADGPKRLRVGLKPEGRSIAREGCVIQSLDGQEIGLVTSGGFGPTVGGPVAMGYVDPAFSEPGTPVHILIRGKAQPAAIHPLPFIEQGYKRKS